VIGAVGNLAGVLGPLPRAPEPPQEVRLIAGDVVVRVSVPDGIAPETVLLYMPPLRLLLGKRR